MLDGLTDTRPADDITVTDEASEPTERGIAPASLAARCTEAAIATPTKTQLAAIRRKAAKAGTAFDDELDAWIARARRRKANQVAKSAREARKTRLTHRAARMARAMATRGEKTERRAPATPAEPREGQGLDVRFTEIDNPYHSRAHAGAAGNPAEIVVARNFHESPLVLLTETGVLRPSEAKAGVRFRDLYERAGGRMPSPSELKERVDGGSAPDAFGGGRMLAGYELRQAHIAVGSEFYGIARFVAGEGHSLRELSKKLHTHLRRARRLLRAALDALAQHWGISKGAADDLDEDDDRSPS